MNATHLDEGDEGELPASSPDAVSDRAPLDGQDRQSILAVRDGDPNAFGLLVKRYQKRLFGLTMMMLRDPSVAEEITQDAFVRAYTHLHLYDDRRPFYPWLATIGVRLAQTRLARRARRHQHEESEPTPGSEPTSDDDPLGEILADESGRELWQAVADLPAGERTAVFLYYRQDMKVNDIARALGVTAGTVKTMLFRARKKLRETSAAQEART